MTVRTEVSMRGVRSGLFRVHRSAYVGVVVAAALAALVLSCTFSSLLLASGATRTSGAPHEVARWNMALELMTSFNAMALVLGGLASAVFVASTAAFALEPRIHEFSRLSLAGMTRPGMLRLAAGELTVAVLAGALVGVVAGVPASYGYLAIEKSAGLAPHALTGPLPVSGYLLAFVVTVAIGVLGGLRPVWRVAGTRVLDDQDRQRAERRRTRRRRVWSVVLLMLGVAMLLAPEDVVPEFESTLVAIPAVAVGVTLSGDLVARGIAALVGAVLGAARRPRLLVACRNVAGGAGRALGATRSIVLVIGLLVPIGMFMATGRQASTVELYEPLHTTTVVTFGSSAPSPEVLDDVSQELGADGLVPYAMVADAVLAEDPYATDPPGVLATDLAALASQIDMSVLTGSADDVRGALAATTSNRYAVGDQVTIVLADGSRRTYDIAAEIDRNGYLSEDLIVDYATNTDIVTDDAQVRGFSSAAPAAVRAALDRHGLASADATDRDAWIQEGLDGTSASQRQALAMIFVLPCLLAAVATVLGIRSYSALTQRSRGRLRSIGFTRTDLVTQYAIEVALLLAVATVQILAIIAVSRWKVSTLAASTGFDIAPTIDVPVTAVASGSLLAVFLMAHLVTQRRVLRQTGV